MLHLRKIAIAACAIAGAALTGGCTDYGYGGVNVGYGAPGYYDGYGYGYDGYGAGYGGPYGYAGLGSGWYDNYYYPGTGYYVYDRGGRRQRWNDGQRRHWEGQCQARGEDRGRPGFGRDRGDYRRDGIRSDSIRGDGIRGNREAWRQRAVTPDGARPDRDAYRQQRQAARETWRAQRGTIDAGQRPMRREGLSGASRGGDQRGFRGGFRGGGARGGRNPQQ